ncbi:metal ABC transporter substrate-binding protein [Floricoccus penangensis]|uniref:metal ABC transporter substrate-binding protein n=1 Tax=Floricoccus penangensis TaxID=1859475 RepID=UPI00203A52AB|nr:metal ABC transporter substrate-binding protein [Floricoccus penangensis]URZ87451.1 metal ABC transporter substrate-binding protein [Floricoccus penangensis]
MKKIATVFTILIVAVGLVACSKQKTSDKIQIITTFYPMYEFTKEVAGDHADVSYLVPAGQEVHDYEPSARDMAKITDSDVLVYNNDNLEKWFSNAKKNIKDKTLIIEASKNVKMLEFDKEAGHDHKEDSDSDHSHDEGSVDPHTWLSLKNAQIEVQTIADDLSKKYPDYKEDFQKNAQAYLEKLDNLEKEYATSLDSASNKKFVTQHAAFGYLANDYGLTQIAIAGLTPDAEPSSATLAKLKKIMQENNLNIVYFEENADDKIAKTLANEVGAETLVLNTVEGITKDEQKNGATYISIMEANLENLKKSVK